MRYFFANLAAHILVFIVLTILIVFTSNRNKKRKVKHGVFFLLPVLFAICACAYAIYFVAPHMMDITSVVNENYQTTTGVVEEVFDTHSGMIVNGEIYYINPLRTMPEVGTTIEIEYTNNSHYIMVIKYDLDPPSDPAEGDIPVISAVG